MCLTCGSCIAEAFLEDLPIRGDEGFTELQTKAFNGAHGCPRIVARTVTVEVYSNKLV